MSFACHSKSSCSSNMTVHWQYLKIFGQSLKKLQLTAAQIECHSVQRSARWCLLAMRLSWSKSSIQWLDFNHKFIFSLSQTNAHLPTREKGNQNIQISAALTASRGDAVFLFHNETVVIFKNQNFKQIRAHPLINVHFLMAINTRAMIGKACLFCGTPRKTKHLQTEGGGPRLYLVLVLGVLLVVVLSCRATIFCVG